ncbi:hypothetical protein [Streptomyces griseosporeus]|uniref:hypothetical protein n=1 Tax=Streptomyces griseosporeus TaxID=1910 RepID=UPI0037005065
MLSATAEGPPFRRELSGPRPVENPAGDRRADGEGNPVLFEPDATWAGTAQSTGLAALDLHFPDSVGPLGPGCVTLRDPRDPHGPVTVRLQ